VEFEWDEAKRQSNLDKHAVDFVDTQALFDGRSAFTALARPTPEEQRYATTGVLDGRFYTVVWTWRGNIIRLISARRARDAEERAYRTVFGG
jgi:uncharacterized DUF497 family protein